ncbi:MAG TPA: hypothetical protein DCZ10_15375 [Pelotomaculum sp.]|nr:hypothetical protein [Pelotomaculum sp.]
MLKESVTIEDAIELLNDAFSKDPDAMHELVTTRFSCNEVLADHQTIQVWSNKEKNDFKVGIIGLLNGIFGTADDGWGAIASDFDVVCPNGHELPEKSRMGDQCVECGDHVVMKLIGFKRIR